MNYTYYTSGTCCKKITFDIKDNCVFNIHFEGGCPGNLKMISKILEGWSVEKVISTCRGNLCGIRGTSCCDQLALGLEKVLEKAKQTS